MKFIRKNGRVIPIRESNALRDRVSKGAENGAIPGAVVVGSLWQAGNLPSINPMGIAFWGHKGAITGGVIGGLVGAAAIKKAKPMSEEGKSRALKAFNQSLKLSLLGTVGKLAFPFTRGAAKSAALWTSLFGATSGTIAPIYHAMRAPKGERGRVLVAGAVGDVLGANALRIGAPIARNRKLLGLRRIG